MFKGKKLIFIFAISLFLAVYFLTPLALQKLRWKLAAEAAGGFPLQIGLAKVAMIPCVSSGEACAGGTLCYVKDPATCANYYDVSGMPAMGLGGNVLLSSSDDTSVTQAASVSNSILLSQAAVAKSGLKPGGQLIAGGMSPVFMDNGVAASGGGCYGCVANLDDKPTLAFWAKVLQYLKILKL